MTWLCAMVVMLSLGETRAGDFFAADLNESGEIHFTTQESIGENYDASQYDASGYAVALKSGTGKPWTTGAKPNFKYNHLDKNGKVKQTAVYDKDGNVIGHVDYKNHGKSAPSGHGYKFPEPGNPASGHGKGKPHIPRDQLPRDWTELPKGVEPLTPIGQ